MTYPGPVPIRQTAALLTSLQTAVERAYAAFGDSANVPEVRIHHGSQAPFDCADVAWILNRGIEPAPITNADLVAGCMLIADAVLAIEICRCWPAPDAAGRIDVAGEAAAAERLARDATVLWYGIGQAWAEQTLFPDHPNMECEMVRLGLMSPVSPGGGFAGWSWPIRARVGLTVLSE